MYPHLFEPIQLGPTAIRNRVFSPPHGTTQGMDGMVTDQLTAYHQARAVGGVGLIILEGMTVHPSYGFEDAFLYAGSDKIIPGMKRLGDVCREHQTPVFGQLFHAGRAVRLSHDGSRPLTYSASDVPDERYRVVSVPMSRDMIWEIIDSYINAAGRLAEAELDGVEILASMGYLIAQFLNPLTNNRDDEFGGSLENRMRLLRAITSGCRKKIGADKTLGIRITLDEKIEGGLTDIEALEVCKVLDQDGDIDYFSVISGSTAAPSGWVHVFPPMAIPNGFVAHDAARLKQAVSRPVLVAGRINQPQLAEEILSRGQADMIGMARALIADPEFVNKASSNHTDDIRACIGCNQACVGHRLAHHVISCIQNPSSGRELAYRQGETAQIPRSVLVVGGGPAGMKAAVTAAQRGHKVELHEISDKLGGQVNLAEKLPGRAEFGGVKTNLEQELKICSVDVHLNSKIDQSRLQQIEPDTIIVATGAIPRLPEVEANGVELVHAWDIVSGKYKAGHRVVIADWACDWSGLGIAQKLAMEGHSVRLLCGGSVPGESLQGIVRDHWIGELHKLQVEMITFARLYGIEEDSAFFQHMISGEPIICESVDTVVSCYAPRANGHHLWIDSIDADFVVIGDAISPRTVEEAVLEGFQQAWKI